MEFVQTEEQRLIVDAVRKLLEENCTTEHLRRMLTDRNIQDPVRWAQMREMGLPSMLAPVERGGMGLEVPSFADVAEVAGYVALPESLVEFGGVVIPLLAELTDNRGWLERALSGATLAIGHPQQRFISDAAEAEALILAAGDTIHIVERSHVELVRQESIDPFRRLYKAVWTPSTKTLVGQGEVAHKLWRRAFERGALFTAAQCLGLAQRTVDMGVAYAKNRIQFGKPIGSYQAVKHMLATAQVQIEFARPVLQAAAAELSVGGPVAAARVSHAKLAASEAADLAARTSLQVHGAMGYTWEVDLHFFMKRALALTSAWGTVQLHRNRVIERMLNVPIGPDAIFAAELV
jgi:alkylation response protein AidB-like acyl-CoA dehydrogenase